MNRRIYYLNRLKEGADAAAFERLVREVEAPLVRTLPAIHSYSVTRLEGPVDGEGPAPYDYVEALEVADLDSYRAGFAGRADVDAFFAEWSSYVGESVGIVGEVVAEERNA